MEQFPQHSEIKKNNLVFKLFDEQMAAAVKDEDYEQAAFLRDRLDGLRAQGFSHSVLYEEDILSNESKLLIQAGHAGDSDNPDLRAWEGLQERQKVIFMRGQDQVENSVFAKYLSEDGRFMLGFVNELWEDVKYHKPLKKDNDERAEFVASLYNSRREANYLTELAKEKFDDIWQGYSARKQAAATSEDPAVFPGMPKGIDKMQMTKVAPEYINRPAEYWRGIYDNSRRIADELEMAIKEMEGR